MNIFRIIEIINVQYFSFFATNSDVGKDIPLLRNCFTFFDIGTDKCLLQKNKPMNYSFTPSFFTLHPFTLSLNPCEVLDKAPKKKVDSVEKTALANIRHSPSHLHPSPKLK